jgi:glutamine synthetase adenylyltransferase
MKTTTWKAVFAAMSPSPVFEAISEFAEQRVDERRRALLKAIDETIGSPVVRRRHNSKVILSLID